ncbi:terpenoid synthase [Artomyces pyxidatus]|uniref:Terpenoid synthase n=1 Tax=Artomyces pyxidatus TaxID=48021 RepID=A0ACB8T1Y3_9AGAM|nr:terpenoid synthase [Artomyces pyxidatus]
MPSTSQLVLPDSLAQWPWKRTINPHYAEVKAESDAWIQGLRAFGPKAQKAFDMCDFALLAALTYPNLDKEELRIGCDLIVLLFVFDDYSDQVDGEGVQAYVDMVMDAIHHPHKPRPAGESVVAEVARQFWLRTIKRACPGAQKHFIRVFTEYVTAVVEEAHDRFNDHVRSIESYMALRRRTGAPFTCFVPYELKANFPDEVIYHPEVVKLTNLAAESVVLTNDLYSYNIEQSAGHQNHNVVTAVMHEMRIPMDQAVAWIARYHDEVLTQFLDIREKLPSFGEELDRHMALYVDGLAHWIRGSDSWSFESKRYFGDKGLKIQEHRVVDLLPKVGMAFTPMMAITAEVPSELTSPAMAPSSLVSSAMAAPSMPVAVM